MQTLLSERADHGALAAFSIHDRLYLIELEVQNAGHSLSYK